MASEASRSVADVVDPDVDLHVPRQRRELGEHPVAVLGSISAGGVVGALARYGLGEVLPRDPGGWPWATWAVNVSGCLLIGVLMVLISEVWTGQRLLRPFLGVGVLGGFTSGGHGGRGDVRGDHRFRGYPVGAGCGQAAGEAMMRLAGSALRLTIFVGEFDGSCRCRRTCRW